MPIRMLFPFVLAQAVFQKHIQLRALLSAAEWQKQAEQLGHAGVISTNQAKRIFAIAGGNQDAIKKVISKYGYTGTKDIAIKDYNNICRDIEMEVM